MSVEIKKTIKCLLLLAAFMAVVVGVNIGVDPANIIRNDYAKQAAEIVAAGDNVTNLLNFDDREFVNQYAQLRKDDVDVLVLGSSRSLQVTKDVTGVDSTFCAGVTGADLRDCIAAYMQFRQNGKTPQQVVICAEYWFLSNGNLNGRAKTEMYEQFCQLTGNQPFKTSSQKLDKVKEMVSFSYFQTSLDYLFTEKGDIKLAAVSTADNAYPTRRADGSYSYEEEYRNRDIIDIDADAVSSTHYNSIDYTFNGVDDQLVKQFEDFIRFIQADGAQVVLQLAPLHPIYYNHMAQGQRYAPMLATQDYFYSLQDTLGVQCFGGYNPADFGMVNTDFYDAQHPTAQGIYKYYGVKAQ